MLFHLLETFCPPLLFTGGIALLLTVAAIAGFSRFLPKDKGRAFAVGGDLSKGKTRGAGLLLAAAFILSVLLCVPLSLEYGIYLLAFFVEMISGYLDDASEKPWSGLKKGLIDLFVAIAVSFTVCIFRGSAVEMPILGLSFTVPAPLYIFLGTVLIWASINVTNCSDGVDGLCGSLVIVSFTGVGVLAAAGFGAEGARDRSPLLLMTAAAIAVMLVYLWYNCSPSRILMGDAGSRAVGMLLALLFMLTGTPFLFIPCALVIIIDGGLGLLKLTVRRVTKFHNFMENVRTPIHDHARKNRGWSDTQVVTRFTLLQLLLTAVSVLLAIH